MKSSSGLVRLSLTQILRWKTKYIFVLRTNISFICNCFSLMHHDIIHIDHKASCFKKHKIW